MSNGAADFSLLAKSAVATRPYKKGETIFNEGDPATGLYVIQSGRVGVMQGGRMLDTLEPNTIFGEMALIDGAPRSTTPVTSTDLTLVPVSEKQFLLMVSETPFFALSVMRVLAQRLRASN